MRKTTTAIAAVLAVMAAGAAPAMACESYAPCGQTYYAGEYGFYGFEHLPDPANLHVRAPAEPRYYYVNQGPAYYTGPGMYAPVPTYQERAVTGWHGYDYGYYYGYNGGPYGDATSHYYDGMPAAPGPMVYRYGPWHHHYHHHHHSMRYGAMHPQVYAGGPQVRSPGPRIVHVPHHD